MNFQTFNCNCAYRPRRAKVFAFSASYADFLRYHRAADSVCINHADGAYGALPRAFAASGFTLGGKAELGVHNGGTYVDERFGVFLYRQDRA